MIVWYTLWYILLNTLIVIGVLIGASLIILIAALCLSVKADIAANGKKAIITLSILKIIKYTFEAPFTGRDKPEPREREDTADSLEDKDDDNDSKNSKLKIWLNGEETSSFSDDLKSLWNSDYNVFDFEVLHSMIIKYAEIISDYKYGAGRFFKFMRYKIHIDRLDVYMKYGTGSPDKTGIAYGAIYAGFECVSQVIMQYFKTKLPPRLYLDPDYVNRTFDFEVGIVVKTRVVHLLNAAVYAIILYVLRKRKRIKLRENE